ncbi:MAG: hypothetical protein KF894_14320 [Labilithrix sp.]|nr:hypothetical protein [Labilithrix sp.]
MKRSLLILISLSAFALTACDEGSDSLTGGAGDRGPGRSPTDTAGGEDGTYNHSNDPAGVPAGVPFDPPDPAATRVVGSPEIVSRLHSCGKMTVASVGDLLQSRGLTGGGQRPNGAQSGQQIFNRNDTAAAMGGANYNGRVPEAPFASTAAVSKMFDIFSMASYDAVSDNWSAPACPGVQVIVDGKFSKDGISCLIGKPATEEHVAIANDAISKNPQDGAKIAIAALLAAAHTCQ